MTVDPEQLRLIFQNLRKTLENLQQALSNTLSELEILLETLGS